MSPASNTRGIGRRQRITREILRHVDSIMVAHDLDVEAMSTELRDFLRPLDLRQIKAVVLAAAKSDPAFWDKFGGAMELLLAGEAAAANPGGRAAGPGSDQHGLGALVGDALVQARKDLDDKLSRGLNALKDDAA